MSIFSIEDYKVREQHLDIYIDSPNGPWGGEEKLQDIEVIFRNRKNRDRIYYKPIVYNAKHGKLLTISFEKCNVTLENGIFDLAFRVNEEEYRLHKEVSNINENFDKYSEDYIIISENSLAVPYLTTKSELSVLCGPPSEVFNTYCKIVKGNITAKNVQYNEGILSLTLKKFDTKKYSYIGVNAQNIKNNKVEDLPYNLCDDVFNIALDHFNEYKLNDEYRFFIEGKVGNILRQFTIGVEHNGANGEILFNAEEIEEKGKKLLFVSEKGHLAMIIANNHVVDKKNYEIVNSTIFIKDYKLDQGKLSILLEEERISLYKKAIVLQGIKNNHVLTLNKHQFSFNGHEELILDLNNIFKGKIFEDNKRWKLCIKLYDEENRKIEICALAKSSAWIEDPKERYMKPLILESGYNLINYLSSKNEIAFLIGDMEDYRKETYRRIESTAEIDNIEISGYNFTFDILNLNKDLVENILFLLVERKSKKKWVIDLESNLEINLDNNFRKVTVDLDDFIKENCVEPARWDAYIEIVYDDLIVKSRLGQFNKKVLPQHKRYFDFITTDSDNAVCPYFTLKNQLSIIVNKPDVILSEQVKSNVTLIALDMQGSNIKCKVSCQIERCDSFTVSDIVMKHRSNISNLEYTLPFTVAEDKGSKVIVNFVLDFKKYYLEQFYWDFFLVVKIEGKEYRVKVKNTVEEVKSAVDNNVVRFSFTNNDGYIIYPYISRVGALALCYRKKAYYESNIYKIKENLAYYTYRLFKKYFDKKDIWLGYEKFSEGAQDNGFYFFQYCYKNNKKKNFYYIIKKDSSDYENVKDMKDKILDFMSFKYMIYMYAAKLLVSSESKGHSYDVRIEKGRLKRALEKKKIVFLQHGVIALKKIDYIFKKSKGNVVDLFVVSSEYEKNIIKNHFDYKEDEIINTGLCRWDVLEDKSSSENREILLMPTWRSWMDGMSDEKFMESDYYKNYLNLLNSDKLHNMISENNIKLKFFIHPKFKEYIGKFSANNENVEIYQYGEVKVNDLLMRSSMLITDYSSVAWDMYYQKKPIVFYQFDIEDYDKYQGSYLDMSTEIFGDRVFDVDELVNVINEYITLDFKEKSVYGDMRSKYFSHVDKKNCERTYKIIMSKKKMLYKK